MRDWFQEVAWYWLSITGALLIFLWRIKAETVRHNENNSKQFLSRKFDEYQWRALKMLMDSRIEEAVASVCLGVGIVFILVGAAKALVGAAKALGLL